MNLNTGHHLYFGEGVVDLHLSQLRSSLSTISVPVQQSVHETTDSSVHNLLLPEEEVLVLIPDENDDFSYRQLSDGTSRDEGSGGDCVP
jgi:hypothetical protein